MTYTFEPYDVLQVQRKAGWADFSTLRTREEGEQAVELVDRGRWDGVPTRFRIVQRFPLTIKYPPTQVNPQETDNVTRGRIQES